MTEKAGMEDMDAFLARHQSDGRWAEHINQWNRRTNDQLLKDLTEYNRSMFGAFANNAKTSRNLVAAILLQRGVTHIPNIFGPIEIKLVF